MGKKWYSAVGVVLVALALLTASAFAAGPVVKWKGESCFGVASPLGAHTIVLWKNYVDQMSGGRMEITLHDAGEIVPPAQIYDAVAAGMLDFGLNTPAYQKGKFPAGDLYYTLPGGVLEMNDLLVWLYGGGGKELEQEMYGKEIVVFPLGLTPPEEVWTKKPVRSIADLKGMKIRSAGLCMDMWERLGASVVLLPPGEVLPGLQRGLIDATEMLEASFDKSLGLPEVCKYRFGPPIHMSNNIFQLLIKPKSYNALPADLKAIVEKAAQAATMQGYADFWQDTIKADKQIREAGIVTTKLPKEDQAKAREITMQILDEKSAKDPFFKKVWESQKAFIEKFRPYYDLTKFD